MSSQNNSGHGESDGEVMVPIEEQEDTERGFSEEAFPDGLEEQSKGDIAKSVIFWAQNNLDLNDEMLGNVLDVSSDTIRDWKNDRSEPQKNNFRKIEKLRRVKFYLQNLAGGGILNWATTPLGAFEGSTPREVLVNGNLDQVLDLLATTYTGGYV